MALTIGIEFTALLQLHQVLMTAHAHLTDADRELQRLANEEMLPVRTQVDRRMLQALADQAAVVQAAMQKATATVAQEPQR